MSDSLGSGLPLQVRSAMPGNIWPAVPGHAGAVALAIQYQLAQSQWFARERLERQQFLQLDCVLRHACAEVPHYRASLADAGYRPDSALTPELFARLPVLARRDVQAAGDRLFAASIPPQHGRVHAGETSGSTGRPVVFRSTELEQLMWNACTLRDHLWHGRHFDGGLAAIRYTPQGGRLENWGPATEAVVDTGVCDVLSIETDTARQVEWLLEKQPEYLLSYASNIAELARIFTARKLRLPRLREVRSVSEVVTPELRAGVREAWGVKLTDMYTTKEIGYVALQCPQHDHYHVQMENVLVEIVDERDRPCAPGQAGRVLVTALHKFAMPLIRYDIGDYAVPGEACSCGRGLPVLREILGRERNMLRLPDGTRRWPLCDLVKEPDLPGILQYQYVQKSLAQMEVNLVVGPRYSRALEPTLAAIVCRRLGHPFDLTIVYRQEIPRSAGGKYEDFRCEMVE